jgi:PAS domain S-box-containing protein
MLMIKFGLRTKYSLLLTGVVMAAALVISAVFVIQAHYTAQNVYVSASKSIKEIMTADANERGQSVTDVLTASLAIPLYLHHYEEVSGIAKAAARMTDVKTVAVYNAEGHLIHDGIRLLGDFGPPAPADLLKAVLEEGKPLITNVNGLTIISGPVMHDNKIEGMVSLGFQHNNLESGINKLNSQRLEIWQVSRERYYTILFIVLVFFLFSSVAIGIYAARRISKPIEILAIAAKQIGEGSYDISFPPDRKDEIGDLAAALKKMATGLKKTTVSMHYLDNIIGNMRESLIVANPEGCIEKVNRAACELSGYTESELIGQPSDKILIIQPTDLDKNAEVDDQISTSRPSTLETKDGRKITVLISQTPLKPQGTEKGGNVYVFNDISGIKQREADLKSARDEAMIANRSKSQFLATMSHELRTPLNAIIGFSSMLKDQIGGPLSEKYQSYAVDIYESADHLLMIINDLLDISKLEAGKMEVMEEPVELSETIYASIRLIREKARAKGITINSIGVDDVPAIFADRRMIKQMVTNLLSNAYKFNQEGGTIDIEAIYTPDQGLDLSVADTGIGIAKEDLARITLPFSQVESHISRNYQGTGLGLAITKSMMELHGGALLIDSEKGKGTKVTLHFPAACVEV